MSCGGPLQVKLIVLADARRLPEGRHQAGDHHLTSTNLGTCSGWLRSVAPNTVDDILVKPFVGNSKLSNIVDDLCKGPTNPGRVGELALLPMPSVGGERRFRCGKVRDAHFGRAGGLPKVH